MKHCFVRNYLSSSFSSYSRFNSRTVHFLIDLHFFGNLKCIELILKSLELQRESMNKMCEDRVIVTNYELQNTTEALPNNA